MRLMRSLMFVPGHRQRMVDRALGLGEFGPSALDVAILDLEDGVPVAERGRARATIAAALARPSAGGPARFVRVNADPTAREADLAAVVRGGLDAIVAPKIDHPDELATLTGALAEAEAAAGLEHGSIELIASVESARGLLEAPAIAGCSDRVTALLFGAEDFARDLALPTKREAEAADLLHARASVVVAAVACRRHAIDGIWPDVHDAAGLRRDALIGRRLGFAGKSLIHPGQVDAINDIFSPSDEEVDYAQRVVAAFDDARNAGLGAVALGGRLLDAPIVERARATLALHDAIARKQRTPPVERPAASEGKRLK
jgi:citrate lyase subunit beta / citryl-CoA lyase